jgi:serine/threonine-protein kinase/endoribonuclease IRE1
MAAASALGVCLSAAQKLPLSVPELVELSPSVTEDGAYVLGSRDTTIFSIDLASGALVRAYLEFGGKLTEVEALLGERARPARGADG